MLFRGRIQTFFYCLQVAPVFRWTPMVLLGACTVTTGDAFRLALREE